MKAKNVIEFYILCNKLKNTIRTGWKTWNVQKERIESVAEHIYGVQMLAISIWSEYKYNLDIEKVIIMLATHELEEIIIGDISVVDQKYKQKTIEGNKAVKKILKNLIQKDYLEKLIQEFNERKTKEARFAFQCDKLEADIQSKIYDEENLVDINNQTENKALEDQTIKKHIDAGKSWSEMWMTFGRERYNYDKNFTEVSLYAQNNKINEDMI